MTDDTAKRNADIVEDLREVVPALRNRIKELEAKLAKAVDALEEISHKSMGEDGCYYTNRVNIARARAAIKELTGETT
jgi:uncharacterized coiled-coil protein SlyX